VFKPHVYKPNHRHHHHYGHLYHRHHPTVAIITNIIVTIIFVIEFRMVNNPAEFSGIPGSNLWPEVAILVEVYRGFLCLQTELLNVDSIVTSK
jgi:hypothetical protein